MVKWSAITTKTLDKIAENYLKSLEVNQVSAETRKVYPQWNYSDLELQALTSAALESQSVIFMAGQLARNLRGKIPGLREPPKEWDLKTKYKLCLKSSAGHKIKSRTHKRDQEKKAAPEQRY